IDELGRLPGIGPKSAQRIAFFILKAEPEDVSRLAEALNEVKRRVRLCEICGNVSESEKCRICTDPKRTEEVICVVEESNVEVAKELKRAPRKIDRDAVRAVSPTAGPGSNVLRVRELFPSVANREVMEIIIASGPIQ